MSALMFVPYLAAATFVAAVVVRWIKIARLPEHLRWELYPVAHEKNAAYGGSFFEQPDWWKHERQVNRSGELGVMLPEILLLKGVHAHNRSLWWRSYPFHGGLYLLAGFVLLLVVGAISERCGVRVGTSETGVGALLALATVGVGSAGFAFLGAGAAGLFVRRLSQPALRQYSSLADFVNLLLFIALAAVGLAAFVFADRDFGLLRGFAGALLGLRAPGELPALVAAEVVAGSVLVGYIPLTHMSHFFTKWFMYHDVRWNDQVNRVGSKLEATLGRQLGQKVSWSAPHIRGEGKKTWVDVATEEVAKP
jgi:nitrate reductase gamma subunit